MPKIQIRKNLSDLSRRAAELFVSSASDATDRSGRFVVSLSGGSTPKALYQLLATDEFSNRVDWQKVYFFFGDERFVPIDSKNSNFRMLNESLFEPLKIPDVNIFRWRTELDNAEVAAADYETRMITFFELNEGELARFDLTLLGLGEDGHTASLFPGSLALEVTDRLAIENWVEKFQMFRLTMTYPVINNSAACAFLVSGEAKAAVLAEILGGTAKTGYPAKGVAPLNGELIWLLDEAAASKLTPR